VDERIPLPTDELERIKILLSAYRTDIEQGKPGKPGYYHFIPVPSACLGPLDNVHISFLCLLVIIDIFRWGFVVQAVMESSVVVFVIK